MRGFLCPFDECPLHRNLERTWANCPNAIRSTSFQGPPRSFPDKQPCNDAGARQIHPPHSLKLLGGLHGYLILNGHMGLSRLNVLPRKFAAHAGLRRVAQSLEFGGSNADGTPGREKRCGRSKARSECEVPRLIPNGLSVPTTADERASGVPAENSAPQENEPDEGR